MKHVSIIVLGVCLMTSCLGQGERQVQMLERIYGKPMREILAQERPKQIKERRKAGERIDIVGDHFSTAKQ